MGEHLDSNTTLYVDTGNGWQPMGKIAETPEFIADGEAKENDFADFFDNDFTMTFRMTWWSRVKIRWVIAKYRIKRLIRKILNGR